MKLGWRALGIAAWSVAIASNAFADSFVNVTPTPMPTKDQPPTLTIERFDGTWEWSDPAEKDKKEDYFIAHEKVGAKDLAFLRAEYLPGTSGHPIQRKIAWSTKDYPFLRWRWRVNAFPTGAKIMDDDKSDAAAQVYVSWKIGGRAYALKYFWSETDAVGMSFHAGKWNPVGRYFGLVIRMGGKTGEWVTETRNLNDDFRKAYDKDAPPEAVGIAVLTDGDQTHTEPKADYADFEAVKNP